ncbi:uncharacterized protein LOC141583889 [Saimiri boliviensis]|uniref:uncharacterized protein LOC141583889 n=1 Tax=Saimiri boliviensis TaxID=27679 RepID=UPI003D77E3C1
MGQFYTQESCVTSHPARWPATESVSFLLDGASRGMKEGRRARARRRGQGGGGTDDADARRTLGGEGGTAPKGVGEPWGPQLQLLCPSPQRTTKVAKRGRRWPCRPGLALGAAASPEPLVVLGDWKHGCPRPPGLPCSSSGSLPWPGGVQAGRRRGVITTPCTRTLYPAFQTLHAALCLHPTPAPRPLYPVPHTLHPTLAPHTLYPVPCSTPCTPHQHPVPCPTPYTPHRHPVPCTLYPVPHPAPGIVQLAPFAQHPHPASLHPAPRTPDCTPCTPQPASCTPHPESCTPHPTSCIRIPAPRILHPAPCILHPTSRIPTPRILHPAPCIPNPKSKSGSTC